MYKFDYDYEYKIVKRRSYKNNYYKFIHKLEIPIFNFNRDINFIIVMKKYYWDFIDKRIKIDNNIKFKKFILDVVRYKNIIIKDIQYLLDKYYKFIAKIPKAGAIIINKNNEIIFIKNKGFHKWCLPKGKADFDENGIVTENIDDCAVREVLEETGVNIKSHIDLNNKIHIISKNLTLYIVKNFNSIYRDYTKSIPNEITKVEWIHIDKIPKPFLNNNNKIIYHSNDFSSYVLYIVNKYIRCNL